MNFQTRTDLAVEAHELYTEQQRIEHCEGVTVETKRADRITVTCVKINSKSGEEAIGKPCGNYITLELPTLIQKRQEDVEQSVRLLSEELTKLIPVDDDAPVLVAGLGNWQITADSLGPKVVSHLLVTRHMFSHMPEEIEDGVRPVSALSPGVLGLTGIETGEIVRGVVDRVKPKLVIAIDSLASRKLERVSTTIQLSDTGIQPGAGIGNHRMALTEETLGVPVIAIGVPTVVDAATLANDTIDLVIDQLMAESDKGSSFYSLLKEMKSEEKYQLIEGVLTPTFSGNLVVTPKEVDEIIVDIAEIIANAINVSLHTAIGMDDLNKYH